MKRDKPYRLQQDQKHQQHNETITKIQDNKLRREPCKPPCEKQPAKKK